MACSLDTFSPPNPPSNHRISFSNDFAEAHQLMGRPILQAQSTPPSLDFEFSVSNQAMISAEEIFFKGQLLPLEKPKTLREKLLLGDDEEDEDVFSFGPQKGLNKWKELFGLKKPQIGPKKVDKDDGLVEKRTGLVLEHKAQDRNGLLVN